MRYRYFGQDKGGGVINLFRCPDNGDRFIDNVRIFEYYNPKYDAWVNDEEKVMSVRNDVFNGWFSERGDEISEDKFLEYSRKLRSAT